MEKKITLIAFVFSIFSGISFAQPNYSTFKMIVEYNPGPYKILPDKNQIAVVHWSTFKTLFEHKIDILPVYQYSDSMTQQFDGSIQAAQYTMEPDSWGLSIRNACSVDGCLYKSCKMNIGPNDGNVTIQVNRVKEHFYTFKVTTDSKRSCSGSMNDYPGYRLQR